MGGSKHWRFAAARNRPDVDANGADGALDAKERALAEKRFDATRQRADAMAPFSGMLLTSRKHRTSTLGRSCTSEPKAKPIVLKMSRSRSSCYSTPPQGKTGRRRGDKEYKNESAGVVVAKELRPDPSQRGLRCIKEIRRLTAIHRGWQEWTCPCSINNTRTFTGRSMEMRSQTL